MPIYLQISSGRGPAECALAVRHLVDTLVADAERAGVETNVIERRPGPVKETLASALLELSDNGNGFIARYLGIIQWRCGSPFRPGHQRKNWFVSVEQVTVPAGTHYRPEDVDIEVMRASGPGGQHVNVTETAVRAVHRPTGLSACAQDQRSQNANRKKALERLSVLVARAAERDREEAKKARWQSHNELVRGNPVRIYEGSRFTPVGPQ